MTVTLDRHCLPSGDLSLVVEVEGVTEGVEWESSELERKAFRIIGREQAAIQVTRENDEVFASSLVTDGETLCLAESGTSCRCHTGPQADAGADVPELPCDWAEGSIIAAYRFEDSGNLGAEENEDYPAKLEGLSTPILRATEGECGKALSGPLEEPLEQYLRIPAAADALLRTELAAVSFDFRIEQELAREQVVVAADAAVNRDEDEIQFSIAIVGRYVRYRLQRGEFDHRYECSLLPAGDAWHRVLFRLRDPVEVLVEGQVVTPTRAGRSCSSSDPPAAAVPFPGQVIDDEVPILIGADELKSGEIGDSTREGALSEFLQIDNVQFLRDVGGS